jgi:hypothetical protein
MKSLFLLTSSFIGLLFCQVSLFAQDTSFSPTIKWVGLAALEEGQFIKCQYTRDNGPPMPFRPWLTNEYARLGLKAVVNRNFSFAVIPEIKLWNDTWDWAQNGSLGSNPFNQHATVSLADAEGTFSFGNSDVLDWNISGGVIPFKYDADAKNLGEYLFRTGVHTPFVQTSFDKAYATLSGLRINTEILRNLSLDLFLTTETQVQPIGDWSLSFLLGYKLPGFIDIGAGIMFDRLIQVAGNLDHPLDLSNYYKTINGQTDTFSFGGTKIMARLALDPKGFLSSNISQVFGKEDCKIYGEAAILGLKNITAYAPLKDTNTGLYVPGKFVVDSSLSFYSDIKQRIPIMFGFNIPAFKILDYLSVELEWYGWPYATNYYYLDGFYWNVPLPKGKAANGSSSWKYSFNLKKTVWDHISILAQIARDHTRHDVYYNGQADLYEIFQTKDEWGWWLKVQYNF